MNTKTRKASKARVTGSKDSTLFGTVRENTIATYSRNRPVQIAKKYHFLTPDTPEDWIPSSSKTASKQGGANKKSSMPRNTTLVRRGSTLALRNISNIPLEKTLGRTPCALNQQPRRSNRRLTPSGFLPTKVSSSEDKECKIYRAELQSRNNNSKKTSSKKSKVLVSTTTYSSKSMSCCSVCGGGVACTHGHNSLSTIKSMSLCQSLPDADLLDDLGLDGADTSDDSQVSQPHNSTLVEEDCEVELKDIIPQDLSAIMEEPVDEEQSEPPKKSKIDVEIGKLHDGEQASSAVLGPRCSTPTDPENIQPVDPATLDVSPITVNEKICIVPVENKSTQLKETVCQELNTNEADEPDVTPDAVSNKECTCATVEPKQKRKLAYSVDMNKVPDCILLAKISNKKQPVKLLFKQDNNSQYHWSNLPEDVLVHLS